MRSDSCNRAWLAAINHSPCDPCTLVRQLADAAGDVDAFRATYTDALQKPGAAAEVARRLLAAGAWRRPERCFGPHP